MLPLQETTAPFISRRDTARECVVWPFIRRRGGGGSAKSTYGGGGGSAKSTPCVSGGRGGQKRPIFCVRTCCTDPWRSQVREPWIEGQPTHSGPTPLRWISPIMQITNTLSYHGAGLPLLLIIDDSRFLLGHTMDIRHVTSCLLTYLQTISMWGCFYSETMDFNVLGAEEEGPKVILGHPHMMSTKWSLAPCGWSEGGVRASVDIQGGVGWGQNPSFCRCHKWMAWCNTMLSHSYFTRNWEFLSSISMKQSCNVGNASKHTGSATFWS